MDKTIASLQLICERTSGDKFPVIIEIGKPYSIKNKKGSLCAACPVTMIGLYEKIPDIIGEDTLQALTLAIRLVEQNLLCFKKNGGKIFYNDGTTEFDFGPHFDKLTIPNM